MNERAQAELRKAFLLLHKGTKCAYINGNCIQVVDSSSCR